MIERYFDNAATTPVDPRVLREMVPFFSEAFGNSESIHSFGARAHDAVELARERVASLVGASFPEQIVFTSGATESCNWVLRNYEVGFISPWEHSAVRELALAKGFTVLPNDGLDLVLDEGHVPGSVQCQMWVNNEIGTIWDPRVNTLKGDHIFSDATQALGKIPIDTYGIDLIAFSAHKLYGPKGIGGLYVGPPMDEPSQRGGGQEIGLRAGTLNVPGIVGLGAACAIAEDEMAADRERAASMRGVLLDALRGVSDWRLNGGEAASPFILSLSFGGVEGESLVVDLDARGFAVSAGAACSSRSTEPSHVLLSLNREDPWRRGTVRISFGRFNTPESAADLGTNLLQSLQKLRTMR